MCSSPVSRLWKTTWSSLAVVAVLAVAGCATVEAVRNTPPEVWVGIERLLIALAQDLWSILEWLL